VGQLGVKRVVHVVLVLAFGDQDVQSIAPVQSACEVSAGHGVPAAKQSDGGETGLLDLARGRVDDMEEGQVGQFLDALVGGVDGVAGQEEQVRAGGLEIAGLGGEQVPDQVPAALALVSLDVFEVGLRQHEPGAVQATQAPGHQLVDGAVVDGRAGPREAAYDPDGLHASSELKLATGMGGHALGSLQSGISAQFRPGRAENSQINAARSPTVHDREPSQVTSAPIPPAAAAGA
jgi:hypothetical protein